MAYVTEMAFIVSDTAITLGGTCSSFTKTNINDGHPGKFIYAVQAKSDDATDGITGFDFTQDKDAGKRGFVKIDQDLNEGGGTGTRSNYLWTTKDSSFGHPISEFEIRVFDTEQTANMIDHLQKFPMNLKADSGAGAKFVYLLYKN